MTNIKRFFSLITIWPHQRSCGAAQVQLPTIKRFCSLITTATCAGVNPWSHHDVLDTAVSLPQSRRNGRLEAHTSCEVWSRAEARLVRPRCARHSCCSDGQLLAYSAAKRRPATACLRTQFASLVTTLQRRLAQRADEFIFF